MSYVNQFLRDGLTLDESVERVVAIWAYLQTLEGADGSGSQGAGHRWPHPRGIQSTSVWHEFPQSVAMRMFRAVVAAALGSCTQMSEQKFVPALGFSWLTRFYDPVLRATLKEEKFRALLVEQVEVRPGHCVLDVGCGTATLTIMLKQACPEATIVGLDVDNAVLAIARRKAAKAGVDVEFRQGAASDRLFEPGSFDRVVSSLVFHHLGPAEKRRTFAAIGELLKPGGELHIADWGKAQNLTMRLAFLGVQLLDGFASTAENVRRGLVPPMEECGFESAEETHREMTVFGTLSLYRALYAAGAGWPRAGG